MMKVYLLMYVHYDAIKERIKIRKHIHKQHKGGGPVSKYDKSWLFDLMHYWSITEYEIDKPTWNDWWY